MKILINQLKELKQNDYLAFILTVFAITGMIMLDILIICTTL